MTYAASETSQQDGAPIELYEFTLGTMVWRFTSAEIDVVDGDNTYTSAPITRSDIAVSGEKARNAITLTVPRNFPIADLFRITAPTDIVAVTLRRYHRGDIEAFVVAWDGRVLNTSWSGAQAEMQCDPVSVSFARTGLRRRYSRQCSHVLYGTACGLNKADFGHATTVVEQDGANLFVATVGSGVSYAGGFVEWDTGTHLERRFVQSQGDSLRLSVPFQGIAEDDAVTIYPGCDHTTANCQAYENIDNYGGFPFVPTKNPFGSDPVY